MFCSFKVSQQVVRFPFRSKEGGAYVFFFLSFRPKCLTWQNYYIQNLERQSFVAKTNKNNYKAKWEIVSKVLVFEISFDSGEFSAQKLQERPLRAFRETSLRYLNKIKKTEQEKKWQKRSRLPSSNLQMKTTVGRVNPAKATPPVGPRQSAGIWMNHCTCFFSSSYSSLLLAVGVVVPRGAQPS